MTTRIIECFSVMDHGCDGRVFPGRVIASFTNEKHAKAIATPGWDSVVKEVVVVHDSLEDYEHYKSSKSNS